VMSAMVDVIGGMCGFSGACYDAFVLEAIPEEASKLLILWRVLR
jgi:hypothetical protein